MATTTPLRPDPETLTRWDREHVWHPFTQMRDWAQEDPVMIESAKGVWLVDVHGKRYLDGVASMWTNVHGHCKTEIDEALKAQADRLGHTTLLGLANVPSTILAKRLADLTPKGDRRLSKVFYSDNGSTAVEVAVKMAFQYQQHRGEPRRTRFVKLKGNYHGDTIGAVSVGGVDLYHATFKPLLFDTIEAPNPYELRPTCGAKPGKCTDGCIRALEKIFAEHGKEIAGMVLEPRVQGAGGYLMHGPEYVRAARRLCDEHGALLICDEVATGFGRTGPFWAVESAQVVPDLLCTAKGLTAGYLPLAATVATDAVFEAFLGPYEAAKTFFHGHTFTGNPLACAVALASMDLYESERILERSRPRIAHLARRLEEVAAHPHVAEVRQAGFMVGIELVPERTPPGVVPPEYPWEARVGVRACRAARDEGVFLRPLGNIVVLNPPMAITEEEIDILVEGALHGIEVATAEGVGVLGRA